MKTIYGENIKKIKFKKNINEDKLRIRNRHLLSLVKMFSKRSSNADNIYERYLIR